MPRRWDASGARMGMDAVGSQERKSLVKGLAELHGGEVRAHSERAGRGSEFTVRLPVSG